MKWVTYSQRNTRDIKNIKLLTNKTFVHNITIIKILVSIIDNHCKVLYEPMHYNDNKLLYTIYSKTYSEFIYIV